MIGVIQFLVCMSTGFPQSACTARSSSTQLAPGTTWDYPLGYNLTAQDAGSSVKVYGVDLVNSQQSDIDALKAAGHFIVCYFSGGSVENYRDDAKDFPPETVGKVMDGWPDENWVDTRSQKVRDIMIARIALAKNKRCDGIDVDNIDGYGNDTGFDLTEDDGVSFVQAMASAAHAKDMAYGLKNGGEIVDRVINDVQWDINEQCAQFNECDCFAGLIQAGKPVFHVEYTDAASEADMDRDDPDFRGKACGAGGQKGFSTVIKHVNLDKFVVKCN